MSTPLLQVEDLRKDFVARRLLLGRPTATIKAVDGVSFLLRAGETLALVGESGCGKSTVGRLILRLIEPTAGRVIFNGTDVFALSGRRAQLIFQDPFASLNPRRRYPHEFSVCCATCSGGQRRLGLSLVFISHDLAVVKHIADRIAVMYLGRIVETARADDLFASPRHPYTRALLSAIPVPRPGLRRERPLLQGDVPSPLAPPPGCHLHTRCPYAAEVCKGARPALLDDAGHATACHFWPELPHEAVVPEEGVASPRLEKLFAAFTDRDWQGLRPGI